MIRRLTILLLIVGCAVIPKNNGNTNEIIIGVWEAGYASRPELPKHIWTISQDTIVAESFELACPPKVVPSVKLVFV